MFLAGDPVVSELSKGGREGHNLVSEDQEAYRFVEGRSFIPWLSSVFPPGWAESPLSSMLSSMTALLRNQTFFTIVCPEHMPVDTFLEEECLLSDKLTHQP